MGKTTVTRIPNELLDIIGAEQKHLRLQGIDIRQIDITRILCKKVKEKKGDKNIIDW